MADGDPNVFLSWSGERSKAVASALHNWLPKRIQTVRPWMSEADIDKGSRWATEIGKRLEQCRIGIICVTPENLGRPWLLFEAGALSKTLTETFVCTFLLDLEPAGLDWPLAMFQTTKAEREDTRKLLHTIHRAIKGVNLNDAEVDEVFDVWWPILDGQLRQVPGAAKPAPPARSEVEIMEEILGLARSFATQPVAIEQLKDTLEAELQSLRRSVHDLTSTVLLRPSERSSESSTGSVKWLFHTLRAHLQGVASAARYLADQSGSLSPEKTKTLAGNLLDGVRSLDAQLRMFSEEWRDYRFEKGFLDRLVHETVSLYSSDAERTGLEVQEQMEKPAEVEMDATYLQLAFSELLRNSIQYSYRGRTGHHRFVRVTGTRGPAFYRVAFENYGVGLLPSEISEGHIFERFYRGRDAMVEGRSGLGVGLYFVKKVIDHHQGRVEVESRPMTEDTAEGGPFLTRFSVFLPYRQSRSE